MDDAEAFCDHCDGEHFARHSIIRTTVVVLPDGTPTMPGRFCSPRCADEAARVC